MNELYEVEIDIDEKTGHIKSEYWKLHDLSHRSGDQPALKRFDPQSGNLIFEAYHLNGKRHREHGPAEIHYDPESGRILKESWYREDELHRLGGHDLPALIERSPATGHVIEMVFSSYGRECASEGPSTIMFDEHTGNPTFKAWKTAGQYTSLHHGSRIEYHPVTGVAVREEFLSGEETEVKYFRENGPALILRDPYTGQVIKTAYEFRNGQEVHSAINLDELDIGPF